MTICKPLRNIASYPWRLLSIIFYDGDNYTNTFLSALEKLVQLVKNGDIHDNRSPCCVIVSHKAQYEPLLLQNFLHFTLWLSLLREGLVIDFIFWNCTWHTAIVLPVLVSCATKRDGFMHYSLLYLTEKTLFSRQDKFYNKEEMLPLRGELFVAYLQI